MLVMSNSTEQTIPVGGFIVFDTTVLKTGKRCNCGDRRNLNIVKIGSGLWKISFHGNASIAVTGSIGLAIAMDGVVLPETAMTPDAAANVVVNVSGGTIVRVCENVKRSAVITVVNTGLTPVTINADSCLIAERVG